MAEEKPAAASNAAPAKSVAASSGDDGIFGALCYIIAVLVPLFVLFTDKKTNKFLAFHAWQSLLVTVVFIVLSIPISIVAGILAITTGIGGLCIFPFYLLIVVVVLFLAWKAYEGEQYGLPVLGDFAKKQVK